MKKQKNRKPQRVESENPAAAIAGEVLVYDEIEIKTLPDPNCKLCWGTGKSTQRVSTGIPYEKPKIDWRLPEKEIEKIKGEQFIETECDCIVKQNVIKANKEVKAEKPKIIWNGRELSR